MRTTALLSPLVRNVPTYVHTVEHSYNKPEIPGQTVCYKHAGICYIRTISHEVL